MVEAYDREPIIMNKTDEYGLMIIDIHGKKLSVSFCGLLIGIYTFYGNWSIKISGSNSSRKIIARFVLFGDF